MTPTAVSIIVLLFLTLLLLLAILQGVIEKYQRLDDVATKLYLATRWRSTTPRISEHLEADMWAELRDALLLEPGTATEHGVGDPNA